jgi:hypothetical protein
MSCHIARKWRLRFEHDGTEEVMRYGGVSAGFLRGEVALSHPYHVIPERDPLVLLVPYVWTLENRHLEMLPALEEVTRAADV